MQLRRESERSGFTLVELLVVIAIIGILIALLLPAVQAARESARRSQCSNNLKQIGLSFQTYHDTYRDYPTSGTGADPARTMVNGGIAIGNDQAWGWAYQILPFMEREALWEDTNDTNVKQASVPTYFCPSRRQPIVFNVNGGGTTGMRGQLDYMANHGIDTSGGGNIPNGTAFNGIVRRSAAANSVKVDSSTVLDGTSNVLLVAERFIATNWYESPYTGEWDVHRGGFVGGTVSTGGYLTSGWRANYPAPMRDRDVTGVSAVTGVGFAKYFGSAHSAGTNTVLCDGSVRIVRFNVSPDVFRRFVGRKDGETFSTVDLGG